MIERWYRMWEPVSGYSQPFCSTEEALAERLPYGEAVRIRGVNGCQPISTRTHYAAAGWSYLIPDTPEEVLNAPAHFNLPFFEEVDEPKESSTGAASGQVDQSDPPIETGSETV